MEENVKKNDEEQNLEESPPRQIKYVRRLDRTPEKDFHLRSEESKKLSCHKRAVVGKVKGKIDRLENEVEQREKEVESERQLRKVAEEKLQSCLQDMYATKDVNHELRQRLPRANKGDPFKSEGRDHSEADVSEIEEQIVIEEDLSVSSKPKIGIDKLASSKEKCNSVKLSPKVSTKASRRVLDFSEDGSPTASTEVNASGPGPMERSQAFSSMNPPVPRFYGNPYGAQSPYTPYGNGNGVVAGNLSNYQNPYPTSHFPLSGRPMNVPAFRLSFTDGIPVPAQTQSPSLVQQPPQQPPAPSPAVQTSSPSPTAAATSSPTPSTSSTSSSTDTPVTKTTTPTLSGAIRAQRFQPSSADGGSTSPGYGGPVPSPFSSPLRAGIHPGTSVLPDPFVSQTKMQQFGYDQNRQINHLLNEIDAQKAEVRKLKNDLVSKEAELETLKITLNSQSAEKTDDQSEMKHAAGIVEEVYAAQRQRDEAMIGRMRLANDERDDVMTRLRQLEARFDVQSGGTSFIEQSDEDLKLDLETLDNNEDMYVLMSRLDSPATPGDSGDMSSFVRRADAIRQRQREVTNDELQIVIEQRDVALAKCRKLEEELLRYQSNRDADGGMDKTDVAKLATIQQERDMAVAKSKQLDDEIQTLRLYYSLHKSLTVENSYQQPSHNTMHSYQEELDSAQHEVHVVKKENDHLGSELRSANIDKKQLEQALESVTQDKERLQRLIGVLKKRCDNAEKDTANHGP